MKWNQISRDIKHKMNRRIQFFMQRWAIPGCSWAVSCNGIVFSNSEGFKDIENIQKMGENTKMRTGTILAAVVGHMYRNCDSGLLVGSREIDVSKLISSLAGLRNFLKDEDLETALASADLFQESGANSFSKIGFGRLLQYASKHNVEDALKNEFNFDPTQFSFEHTKDTARHYYHKGRTSYPSPDIDRQFDLYSNPKELVKLGPVFARDFQVPCDDNFLEIKIKDGRLRLGFTCINGLQYVKSLPPNGYCKEGSQLACCGSNNGSSTGFIVSRLRGDLHENGNMQEGNNPSSNFVSLTSKKTYKRKLQQTMKEKPVEGGEEKPLITAVVMCNSDNIQMYDITHRLSNHVAKAFELFKLSHGRYPNAGDQRPSGESGNRQITSTQRPGPSRQQPGPSRQQPGPSGQQPDPSDQHSDQAGPSEESEMFDERLLEIRPDEEVDWCD